MISKVGFYPSGNSNENDEMSSNYDIQMDDSSTSGTESDDNSIPKSDINQIGHSVFYETQPKWMSNVNWCWHKAEKYMMLGNKSAERLEILRILFLNSHTKWIMEGKQFKILEMSIRMMYRNLVFLAKIT